MFFQSLPVAFYDPGVVLLMFASILSKVGGIIVFPLPSFFACRTGGTHNIARSVMCARSTLERGWTVILWNTGRSRVTARHFAIILFKLKRYFFLCFSDRSISIMEYSPLLLARSLLIWFFSLQLPKTVLLSGLY